MGTATRGRPRSSTTEAAALAHTLCLLDDRGYDALRMKDIAESAGIGLGALYRRWPGKRALVVAALRWHTHERPTETADDPVADLAAALLRVAEAVPRGLGKLVAACLTKPGSELATVVVEAKLKPLVESVATRLERVVDTTIDARVLAEAGLGLILWRSALDDESLTLEDIRHHVLPAMGVNASRRRPPPRAAAARDAYGLNETPPLRSDRSSARRQDGPHPRP